MNHMWIWNGSHLASGYSCYYCGVYVTTLNGHTPSCSTRDGKVQPPVFEPARANGCDCGSPDAHWQFCASFKPYGTRPDR